MGVCDVPDPPTTASGERLSLTDICLALHGSSTGSCDDLSDERRSELRAYLKARLDAWDRPAELWKRFDDAVFALCVAALNEPNWQEDYPMDPYYVNERMAPR